MKLGNLEIEKDNQALHFMKTTGNAFEGYRIVEYLGIKTAHAVVSGSSTATWRETPIQVMEKHFTEATKEAFES